MARTRTQDKKRIEDLSAKLRKIEGEADSLFIQRGDEIKIILLASLCKENMLLVGPPGTVKSMLIDHISKRFGGEFFRYLLTETTVPEELFGTYSLEEIRKDNFTRITTHRLPEANFIFLDETLNAGSHILNSVLTLMQERLFFNPEPELKDNIISFFGATNQLVKDDKIGAFKDRFVFKKMVSYVNGRDAFKRLCNFHLNGESHTTMTLEDLAELRGFIGEVRVSEESLDTLFNIRGLLKKDNIVKSDRVYNKLIQKILPANALMDGRTEVISDDFLRISIIFS